MNVCEWGEYDMYFKGLWVYIKYNPLLHHKSTTVGAIDNWLYTKSATIVVWIMFSSFNELTLSLLKIDQIYLEQNEYFPEKKSTQMNCLLNSADMDVAF